MTTKQEFISSDYIQEERKEYSLYVLQNRAIPTITDGLKAAGRRVLWIARNGKKIKSATLAGATMPIHPHSQPESTINTLAAPYGNNIPLLHGVGSFGTLLKPTAYGASRYTSVYVSKFTKEAIFRDIDIVPMVENYDGTETEPKHFLPLIPIVLLNPQEGIAVGFASKTLPRSLEDIINDQIKYLNGKNIKEAYPYFLPTENKAQSYVLDDDGNYQWVFKGVFERVNRTTIRITNLPYNLTHEKFTEKKLIKLLEEGKIQDFEDHSRNHYSIYVKFKKGELSKKTDEQISKMFGLQVVFKENMNMIDFDGEGVLTTNYVDTIKSFTDWRLKWYYDRYKRLANLLELDIQRYRDILTAIKKNVGSVAKKVQSRSELSEFLKEIGVIHIDYIADLPIYRFTITEKEKVEEKLKKALELMDEYKKLLNSDEERKKVYETELKDILKKYKRGYFNE